MAFQAVGGWSSFVTLVLMDMCFLAILQCNCLSIRRCPIDHITIIERPENISCLPCPVCKEGHELSIACGSAAFQPASVECKPCRPGTFSAYGDSRACKPCKTCSKHQIVLSECTRTSNTVCGKCGKGFYQDNSVASDCLPCSECCVNGTDDIIEECTQSGLPPNSHCKFHKAKSCQTKCGIRQNTIPLNGRKGYTYTCVDCPFCPAGSGVSVPCGTTLDNAKHNIQCDTCIDGKTFSDDYNSEDCKPCTVCGLGREVKQNCTRFQDTVCGACKPGFYRGAFTKMCHECSWCCSDDKDIIEAQCLAQGMPAEKRCKRNLRSVNECYKRNFKSKSNLKTTFVAANLNNESRDYTTMNVLVGVSSAIITTGIISTLLCGLHYRRKRAYKDDYFKDSTVKKVKVPTALGATKSSLHVKTTATGCQSNELEWPICTGPLVSHNAILFEKSGLEIRFPDRETYRKYYNQIALETIWISKSHPRVSSEKVILSPVFKLHPHGLRLNKPLLITLPHSARTEPNGKEWSMVVESAKLENGKVPEWKDFKKESNLEEVIEEQGDSLIVECNQVKMEIDQLLGFVVIGGPRDCDKVVSKRMQIAVFSKQRTITGKGFVLSVYVLDDCEAPFEKIMEMEKKKGRTLTGSLHSFNLRCNGEGDIKIGASGITPGWEISPCQKLQTISFLECLNSYQEIPHREIKFVHKNAAKMKFQCTVELTESNGKTLAAMPVFVYCYQDPLSPTPHQCTATTNNAIVSVEAQKPTLSDLPRDLTLPEKLNLKPLDLPIEIRKELVNCLDNPTEGLSGWKCLAEELGFSSLEMQYLDPQESPTTQLLYYMDAGMPEITVSEFLQVLQKVEREDVWRLLQNWLQEPEANDELVT